LFFSQLLQISNSLNLFNSRAVLVLFSKYLAIMTELQKLRIDKWLWAVRIYKTRSIAAEACAAGKVRIDGENVKPAYTLKPGQLIIISRDGYKQTLKCLKLIEKRVGAPIAVTCYEDLTPPEEKDKLKFPATFYEMRDKGTGRPTKKDRREIEKFKDPDDID
jgi:ribosome-associated heat shock protein Hsp15